MITVEGETVDIPAAGGEASRDDAPSAHLEIDPTKPSIARAYDYVLGGKNNFEADRKLVDSLIQKWPGVVDIARHNRAFLRRAVRFLVGEAGIRQILDIGSGLPTQGNVHEIAHEIDPSVRVVYVDIDPLVLAHSRALLGDAASRVAVVVADARDPEKIINDPTTQRLIDVDQPLAVIMGYLLHHIPDEDDPWAITKTFIERMVSGSYLVISCLVDDQEPGHKALERIAMQEVGSGFFRTWEQQKRFFEGLEMVEPGLVYLNDWRPDAKTERESRWHTFLCAGVGRKP